MVSSYAKKWPDRLSATHMVLPSVQRPLGLISVVCRAMSLVGVPSPALQLVCVQLLVLRVSHPHRRAVQRNVVHAVVPRRGQRVDVAVAIPGFAGYVIRNELVEFVVGDPYGRPRQLRSRPAQ